MNKCQRCGCFLGKKEHICFKNEEQRKQKISIAFTGDKHPLWRGGKSKLCHCAFCGKEFYIRPTENKKYCSRSCIRKDKTGIEASRWKGGHFSDKRGYRRVELNQAEHRKNMEKFISDMIGEPYHLSEKQVVHHINGNKSDNRIENLLLFRNQGKHLKYHSLFNKLRCLL